MNRNSIIGIIVLVLLVAGVAYGIYHAKHKNDNSSGPALSVAAYNQTQNVDATTVTAHPKDVVVYTLNAANNTDKVVSGYVMEVSIGGVTNVATLVDAQGANYNSNNNSLVWTPLDVPANGSIQKQFTVRVKDSLPANSADKVMKVTFNNEVSTNLDYAQTASNNTGRPGNIGTGSTYKAPKTGIPGWISFYLAAFITFGVMLFRTARKLNKPTN